MRILTATGMITGSSYNPAASRALARLDPLVWFEGPVDQKGRLIDRARNRRFDPIAAPAISEILNSRYIVQFAGGGGYVHEINGETLSSRTNYAMVIVARAGAAGVGTFVANELGSTPMIAAIDASGKFVFAGGAGGTMVAPDTVRDDAFHAHVVSVSPGSSVIRRDGVQVAADSASMEIASGGDSRRIYVGQRFGGVPKLDDVDTGLILIFNRTIHTDAAALGAVETFAVDLKNALNA